MSVTRSAKRCVEGDENRKEMRPKGAHPPLRVDPNPPWIRTRAQGCPPGQRSHQLRLLMANCCICPRPGENKRILALASSCARSQNLARFPCRFSQREPADGLCTPRARGPRHQSHSAAAHKEAADSGCSAGPIPFIEFPYVTLGVYGSGMPIFPGDGAIFPGTGPAPSFRNTKHGRLTK